MNTRLQVRVISPWFGEMETAEAFFSTKIPAAQADALLCDWAPTTELFAFPRRKAWYCCEPWCQFRGLEGGKWPGIRARLAPGEFLFHAAAEATWRVPHVTHFETLSVNKRTDREQRAIAVVSNHGGPPWRRHPGLTYRNQFATHARVDLYGRQGWKQYRAGWLSRAGAPENYKGELPGDWPATEKRALMSRYHVAVCLENATEPHYFSEKFVEAVCAGCVPVYHAHSTIAESVLRGAIWIDPGNYGHDPDATLAAALAFDAERAREINEQWLAGAAVAATHSRNVFSRIGQILGG